MSAMILVVEDEPAIQELVVLNLQQAGHRPVVADSAEQALALMRESLPDMILLDWMLPGMSGVEFARRLKADGRTRDVPIIMLTARGDEQDKITGLETGADDYITKPFSPRETECPHQGGVAPPRAADGRRRGGDDRLAPRPCDAPGNRQRQADRTGADGIPPAAFPHDPSRAGVFPRAVARSGLG